MNWMRSLKRSSRIGESALLTSCCIRVWLHSWQYFTVQHQRAGTGFAERYGAGI